MLQTVSSSTYGHSRCTADGGPENLTVSSGSSAVRSRSGIPAGAFDGILSGGIGIILAGGINQNMQH